MLSADYWLLRLRTSKKYLGFLVFQCLLSVLIIVVGILNNEHLKHPAVLTLEYLLSITILADMQDSKTCSLLRYRTEPDFFKQTHNLFDLFMFLIITGLLISITVVHEGGFMLGLEADDIIALTVLIARYVIQIVRLAFLVRKSHENMKLQRELREVEMSEQTGNPQDSLENEQSDRLKQTIFRKLTEQTSSKSSALSGKEEDQTGQLPSVDERKEHEKRGHQNLVEEEI